MKARIDAVQPARTFCNCSTTVKLHRSPALRPPPLPPTPHTHTQTHTSAVRPCREYYLYDG